jgi:hypothetical protein
MRYAGSWLVKARAKEWLSFVRRYVPWIIGGAIVGYLWWPARVGSYHKFWMPLIGAWLGTTLVRQIVLGIVGSIKKKRAGAPTDIDTNTPQGAHA